MQATKKTEYELLVPEDKVENSCSILKMRTEHNDRVINNKVSSIAFLFRPAVTYKIVTVKDLHRRHKLSYLLFMNSSRVNVAFYITILNFKAGNFLIYRGKARLF